MKKQMKTTINNIYQYLPCRHGFSKLINHMFGTEFSLHQSIDITINSLSNDQKNKKITILEILNSNGVKDAFWALRTQNYLDYCLISADVAESILYIFENKLPENKNPRKCIEGIRNYDKGKITMKELKILSDAAAYAAADASNTNAANAYAYAANAADADAAAYAANAAAYAAADANADAYADTVDAYAYAANAAYAVQWIKNEKILRKYLEK